MITMSDPCDAVWGAILAAQKDFGTVAKGRTAAAGRRGSYSYANIEDVLAAVRPALLEHGVLISQVAPPDGGQMHTRLTHAATQQWVSSCGAFEGSPSDPQRYGSSLTYFRRYNLTLLLGIATEDDDGAAASQPAQNGDRRGPQRANGHANGSAPGDAPASEKQLRYIHKLIRDRGGSKEAYDKSCTETYGKPVSGLTRAEASDLNDKVVAQEPSQETAA